MEDPVPMVAVSQAAEHGGSVESDEEEGQRELLPDQLLKTLHVGMCSAYSGDNMFYSPLSIDIGLGMLLLGAKGGTAKEMIRAGISNNHEARSQFLAALRETTDGSNVSVAARIFSERTKPLKTSFIKRSEELYGSPIYPLEFANDPAGACEKVNKWVAHMTAGKITNLLSSVPPTTSLVLANAIYFKAQWADRFDPEKTHERAFKISDSDQKLINFMEKEGKLELAIVPKLKSMVIRMMYQGGNAAMYLVRPNAGLDFLEQQLAEDANNFDELLSEVDEKFAEQDVLLRMPRFRFETSVDLVVALKKIGINRMFTEDADFSHISRSAKLHVSAAAHKCYVDVTEEGTEAAGATAVTIVERSLPMPPVEVTMDQPFMFFIRHLPTRNTLFVGRYKCPPDVEPEAVSYNVVKQNLGSYPAEE